MHQFGEVEELLILVCTNARDKKTETYVCLGLSSLQSAELAKLS